MRSKFDRTRCAQRLDEYERDDAETVSLEEALEHARHSVRDVVGARVRTIAASGEGLR